MEYKLRRSIVKVEDLTVQRLLQQRNGHAGLVPRLLARWGIVQYLKRLTEDVRERPECSAPVQYLDKLVADLEDYSKYEVAFASS